MRHTAAKAIAALAIAAAATAAAVPAMADPTVTPAAQDIVGVGSDTTQALFNQFSTDYNNGLPATTPHLYSWDATGTSPITPKTGANTITRPNGSSAGISALNANTSTTLDFARSSRAVQTGDPISDDFVSFAKDGITWSSTATSDSPNNLTYADLQGIYNCTITQWSQITDVAGYTGPAVTIKPYLPQTGSGTRSTWLKILGITTVNACVTSGPEENQGTDPVLNDPDVVFPYSAGHYAGQKNGHTTTSDNVGVLVLRQADGIDPITATSPYTVTTGVNGLTDSRYGRVLYNVLRDGDFTANTTQGTALRAIFGASGWICTNTTAANDVASYGYALQPSAACGTVTHN